MAGFSLSGNHNLIHSDESSDGPNLSTVCHNLGTSRDDYLNKHLPIAAPLAAEYRRIQEKLGVDAALSRLAHWDSFLTIGGLNLSNDRKEIREYSENLAHQIKALIVLYSDEEVHHEVRSLLSQHELSPPKGSDLYSLLNRAADPKFWSSHFLRLRIQKIEKVYRDAGYISKNAHLYCSEFASKEKAFQDKQNRDYLENTFLTSGDGKKKGLAEIFDKSISNPKIRRAELMVRLRGFEKIADELNHVGVFYTITTPSRMHAQKGNKPNPKFDGTTPKEANNYLLGQLAKVRSTLHKKNIKLYGFRVAEPHHDATPHHHYLFFMEANREAEVTNTLRRFALQESPDEPGAQKYRFKAESICKQKGGATSYIAKYISKSIDGYGIDKDTHNQNSTDAAHWIRTWATHNRIRQFQQIGGPPVSIWRHLRRLKAEVYSVIFGKAFHAADSSDWAGFTKQLGGPCVKRKDLPIVPEYKYLDSLDSETGEIIQNHHNRYGELKRPPMSGLNLVQYNFSVSTKKVRWHPTRKLMALDSIEGSSSQREEGSSMESSVYPSISQKLYEDFKHGVKATYDFVCERSEQQIHKLAERASFKRHSEETPTSVGARSAQLGLV